MIFVWFLPYLSYREKMILCCSTPILSLGVTFSGGIALNELYALQERMMNTSTSGSSDVDDDDEELFNLVFPSNIFPVDDDEEEAQNHQKITMKVFGHRTIKTTTVTAVGNTSDLNGSSSFNITPGSR